MKVNLKKWLLIIVGTIAWSWTMVKSGWIYSYGMGFWGANGHDGVWHIALIESLSKGSLQMPVFAGAMLMNYHIGFDLIVAVLHKITFIPVVNLYFQIISPVLSLLVGIFTYKFVFNWTKSEKSSLWALFFTYFGGSFGWVLGKGESAFWSQQAISSLINPPFAMSLILLLVGMILLLKLEEKFSVWNLIPSILCFGILIEIKAYAGILALGGLLVVGLWRALKERKFDVLYVFLGSLVLSLLIYLPLNKNASSLLVWQPLWFLETMMGLVDRLNWTKFYSAMLAYRSGRVWIKALAAYGVAFIIFIAGNFGTRLIFIFKKIKFDQLDIFIYSIIGAGIIIPMFFLQKGTPWNTIQFFYYSLFLSGILAGIALSRIKSKVLLILVVLVTVPTTIITLKDVYIPSRPPAKLSKDELSALSFLSIEPPGVVLTKPFDEFASKAAEPNPPRPLYLYTSTAYVSAFSKHQTFLEDEMNLDITGYAWQNRETQVLTWYGEKDPKKLREFLVQNNIKYIYWIKDGNSPLDLGKIGLANIYENNLIIIYQVK